MPKEASVSETVGCCYCTGNATESNQLLPLFALSCHPTFHSNCRLVATDTSLQRPVRRAFSNRVSEVIVVAKVTATCWLDWDWLEPESGPEPESWLEPESGPK